MAALAIQVNAADDIQTHGMLDVLGRSCPHRIQYRLHSRHFMRPKQVRPSECGQHGKKRFGTTHVLAEELKRMGQGMARGPAQLAQSKRVEEYVNLMPDSPGAVLEVSIVKAQARIDEQTFH